MRHYLPKPIPILGATAAALLALTACGSARDAGTVKPSQSAAAQTQLTVSVRSSPSAQPKTWTLTCDPTGGNMANAQKACDALDTASASKKDPFAATPKTEMCTMIFGGPQTATVTGTWQGRAVKASFDRKNGCEMDRWNALSALLGAPPK